MKSTLDRIDNWVEKAERAKYGVAELAEECGISRRQLRRYFHDRCGTSPQRWLDQVRLWKSLAPLLETRHVCGVAYMLGFERVATFNDLFRKQYGIAPREFMVNPEKTLKSLLARNPGLLEADGSLPVDELSKLAASTVKFVCRENKHDSNVRQT